MSTKRHVDENVYAVCETALDSYGYILTYGTTAGQVKKAAAGNYPVGIAQMSTKAFDTGVATANVRIPIQKTGEAYIKMPTGYSFAGSIVEGMGVKSDASGCVAPLAKASVIVGSYVMKTLPQMVGVCAEAKKLGNAGGYLKVFLTLHQVPGV